MYLFLVGAIFFVLFAGGLLAAEVDETFVFELFNTECDVITLGCVTALVDGASSENFGISESSLPKTTGLKQKCRCVIPK